jgi:putative endonuclease
MERRRECDSATPVAPGAWEKTSRQGCPTSPPGATAEEETCSTPAFRYNSRVATWYVYLLRCGDGTLYAGVTTDVQARVAIHSAGKGARYTRGRGPLALVHCEPQPDRGAALRREHELKRLRRASKLALCRGGARSGRAPSPRA